MKRFCFVLFTIFSISSCSNNDDIAVKSVIRNVSPAELSRIKNFYEDEKKIEFTEDTFTFTKYKYKSSKIEEYRKYPYTIDGGKIKIIDISWGDTIGIYEGEINIIERLEKEDWLYIGNNNKKEYNLPEKFFGYYTFYK